jgi:16S rRNA (adenine1518-N6/adenine1519-N6)-dimethyltransferase
MAAPLPRARKRFGQHFLHDPMVLDRIVEAISATSADALVEIGPGRGALTRELIGSPHASLDVIEIDRDLAAHLRATLGQPHDVTVHEEDALDFDFSALAARRNAKLRVVGNLPYNVSTPLLFHLLSSAAHVADMHFMLQREVVARIAAQPGDDDYGRLTVMLAPWITAESLFEVGPGAFHPRPKVWSAVVRMTVRCEPAFAISPNFAAVVAAAFSHRRKTLRNALKDVASREEIESSGIDAGMRPETLSAEEFNRVAQAIDRRMR